MCISVGLYLCKDSRTLIGTFSTLSLMITMTLVTDIDDGKPSQEIVWSFVDMCLPSSIYYIAVHFTTLMCPYMSTGNCLNTVPHCYILLHYI